METKSFNGLSMNVLFMKALMVWGLANTAGTILMIAGAEVRGGFERADTMIKLGIFIAFCTLPAIVILPVFLYLLARVNNYALRLALAVLLPLAVDLAVVLCAVGREASVSRIIKTVLIFLPYVLSASAVIMIITKSALLSKQEIEHEAQM